MTTLAIIPASHVWAAAQFAAKDPCKESILDVCLRVEPDGLWYLYATNGHAAFRAQLALSDEPDNLEECPAYVKRFPAGEPSELAVDEFKFNAAAFVSPGKLLQGGHLFFDSNGTATLRGSKSSDIREWKPAYSGTFPNIRQLWPENQVLKCEPGARIGMGSGYLGTIAKVASKISVSGTLSLRTSRPSSPMVWAMESQLGEVEVLLMPCELRGSAADIEREEKQRREEKLASYLKELAAYRAGAAKPLEVTQ